MKGKAIPAIIGAGISLFFIKSGFLFIFFLVPFGFLSFRYNRRVVWMSLFLAIVGDALLTIAGAAAKSIPFADAMWDFLYFMIMTLIFVWICAPPVGFSRNVPGVMRFIAGSCVGAMLINAILFRLMAAEGFLEYLDSWIEMFASVNHSDVVKSAMLERLDAEGFLQIMKAVMLRGGALVSCVFVFFVSRQVSITFAYFNMGNYNRGKGSRVINNLGVFHVHPELIWLFSSSLLLVVLTRIFAFGIAEIILWNILILCVMLYLAQGLGIMQFLLSRSSMPNVMRFFLVALFVVLMFSPVLNVVLLGAVILLGIAENWVPLRAPKRNGPPSTPKAGDSDS